MPDSWPAKFSPRPLGPDQIERERLLGLLEQHPHAKLVLIQAPAGYGKSTLMTQWYQRLATRGHGTAWMWLDDDDNDAGRLGSGLSQALSPGGGVDLFDAVNRCAHLHAHFTLFLDEEEHLQSSDSLRLLDTLLNFSPASLHLVVGSRLQPQKLSLPLRLRSDFLELTARDLAFRPEEIARFMQSRCRVTLDAQANEQLALRTEGWAAALQLAAVEIAKGESSQSVCEHLAAPRADLFRYLSEEVLARVRPAQREFLLHTAFLSELSGALCNAVTGRSDSEQVLAELQQANLLLQPIDTARRYFRYHALFADLLCHHLREEQPGLLPRLARRASEWCLRSDQPQSAVEYALLAEDTPHLIACIGGSIEPLITRAQFATVKRWLLAIPSTTLQAHPELLSWSAWTHVWTGDFAAAEAAVSAYETLSSTCAVSEKARLEHDMLRALLGLLHGRYAEADAVIESAWPRLATANRINQARLCNLRAVLAHEHGLFGDASEHAQRAMTLATQPPLWLSIMHSAHVAGLTELSLGNLSAAWRRFHVPEQMLATPRDRPESGINPGQLLAVLCGAKSLVLYEWNRLDDAEDCLERHAPFLSAVFSPSCRMLWHQLRARLSVLRGDADGGLVALEEGSAYAMRHGVGWMETLMKWERVDHCLRLGDQDRARSMAAALAPEAALATAAPWISACEEVFGPIISALRLLVHTGRGHDALAPLRLHIALSERQLRRFRLIKLYLLEALALEQTGAHLDALAALRRAVQLGERSGVIRSFVDEGVPCRELLLTLAAQPVEADMAVYLEQLRAAFPKSGETAATPPATPAGGSDQAAPPLSPRERQILQRLAQGHSNLAVGQQLFLSPNTVKWHLAQLYGKLGVSNRTQAVHVARQLRLLQ